MTIRHSLRYRKHIIELDQYWNNSAGRYNVLIDGKVQPETMGAYVASIAYNRAAKAISLDTYRK